MDREIVVKMVRLMTHLSYCNARIGCEAKVYNRTISGVGRKAR